MSERPMKINPELLSKEPTHRHNGLLVKLFTLGMPTTYSLDGRRTGTAQIMEGEDKGKLTTVYYDQLRAPLKAV